MQGALGPDHLERGVDALPAGQLQDPLPGARFPAVDQVGGAEVARESQTGGGHVDGDDPAHSTCRGQQDAEQADRSQTDDGDGLGRGPGAPQRVQGDRGRFEERRLFQ